MFSFFSVCKKRHFAELLIFEHSKKNKKLLFKKPINAVITRSQLISCFIDSLKKSPFTDWIVWWRLRRHNIHKNLQKDKSNTPKFIKQCNNRINIQKKNKYDKRKFYTTSHYKRIY